MRNGEERGVVGGGQRLLAHARRCVCSTVVYSGRMRSEGECVRLAEANRFREYRQAAAARATTARAKHARWKGTVVQRNTVGAACTLRARAFRAPRACSRWGVRRVMCVALCGTTKFESTNHAAGSACMLLRVSSQQPPNRPRHRRAQTGPTGHRARAEREGARGRWCWVQVRPMRDYRTASTTGRYIHGLNPGE